MSAELYRQIEEGIRQGAFLDMLNLVETACTAEAHSDTVLLTYHGTLLRELGNYSRAEAPLLQALSLGAASVGKEHPDYAKSLLELGRLYEETGQYASAERLYCSALTIREQSLGRDHLDTVECLNDLAALYERLGRFEEGRPLAREAFLLSRKISANDCAKVARILMLQAWIAWRLGQPRLAEEQTRQALELVGQQLGPEHPEVATIFQLLARLALHQARLEEAERLAVRALEIREKRLTRSHYRYAGSLENLAVIRALQGKHDEAESLALEGLQITRAALGDRHMHVGDVHMALGYIYHARRDSVAAESQYLRALETYQLVFGDNHPHQVASLRDLAECCSAQQRFLDAEEYQRRALTMLDRYSEFVLLERVELLLGLSRVLVQQNRIEEALECAQGAVAVAREGTEQEDRSLLLSSSLDGLARIYLSQGRLTEAESIWVEVLSLRTQLYGTDHPNYADTLRNLAGLYAARGDFARAEQLEDQAVSILRDRLGEQHPEYARAIQGLAELNLQKGDLVRAETLLLEATEKVKQRVGEQHPEHAHAIGLLGRLYQNMSNLAAAEVRFRQVVEILERVKGDDHPDFASALHDLASIYHQAGELKDAEGLYERARDIRQHNPGEHHPDYGQSLHSMAMVYQAQGRWAEAEPLFRQAVQIHETALGEDNPATLRVVHSLGLFEQSRGEFSRAEELFLRVRSQLCSLLGEFSPNVAPILADLARLYEAMGDPLAAEPLWRQILQIHQQAYPEDLYQQSQDLLHLALCLRNQGEFAPAESLVREALSLMKQSRRAVQPESAAIHGLLANLVLAQDRFQEAEELFQLSLAQTREAFGHQHLTVAMILSELAGLRLTVGDHQQALEYYEAARDVFRRAGAEDRIEHLNLIRLQAGVLQLQGRYQEAEQLHQQRLISLRRLFGSDSPPLAPALQLLADLYRVMGRSEDALALARQALGLLRKQQAQHEAAASNSTGQAHQQEQANNQLAIALAENQVASILASQGSLSEAEPLLRRAFETTTHLLEEEHPVSVGVMLNWMGVCAAQGRSHEVIKLLVRLLAIDRRLFPQLAALAGDKLRVTSCQFVIDHLEFLFSTLVPVAAIPERLALRCTLFVSLLQLLWCREESLCFPALISWQKKYPHLQQPLQRLWQLDRQIANKRANGPVQYGSPRHRSQLDTWLNEREELEQQLAAQIPQLAQRCSRRVVEVEHLSAQLPQRWALVQLVLYRLRPLQTAIQSNNAEAGLACYLALVVRANSSEVELIELGPAEEIDLLVLNWRRELQQQGNSRAGELFRDRVWMRILPRVEDCEGLVLALTGAMLHVPMAVLPLDRGQTLADRFQLRQILMGWELLRGTRSSRGPALVVGEAPSLTTRHTGWLTAVVEGCRHLFHRVSGVDGSSTRRQTIEQILQVDRSQPTIEELMDLQSPYIIHLDAEVFFLPFRPEKFQATGWVHPLECSGIRLPSGAELTSYLISGLDWWGTQVVVLPNLESQIEMDFGWFRLQELLSAILHAGAEYILFSLWKVSPLARELMLVEFYRTLREGSTPRESFALAQQAVAKRYSDLREWAGWILLGVEAK